jgi:hypothetical protein
MKKELSKILKNFEGDFKNETDGIEFSLTRCQCCNDYVGYINNLNSECEWSMDIETIDDVYEFDNMIGLVTGSPFFGLVGILNNIKDKKFNKLIDQIYETNS